MGTKEILFSQKFSEKPVKTKRQNESRNFFQTDDDPTIVSNFLTHKQQKKIISNNYQKL